MPRLKKITGTSSPVKLCCLREQDDAFRHHLNKEYCLSLHTFSMQASETIFGYLKISLYFTRLL